MVCVLMLMLVVGYKAGDLFCILQLRETAADLQQPKSMNKAVPAWVRNANISPGERRLGMQESIMLVHQF